jgi:NAD-dependent SIR2 family protein deacetylase
VSALDEAADAIREADALFIGAGAGMGVDSGLPDFRGDKGFWKAYPPFEKLGLSFIDLANPAWFERDPTLAWGFYGHRLNLYRETNPHRGFALLREWSDARPHGAFVFTSNVDGQFQQAGFGGDVVCECHGSIHHMQCAAPCSSGIWDGADLQVEVDEEIRAAEPLPQCPDCRGIARPNILMFGDIRWVADRTNSQTHRMSDWLDETRDANLVVIESGAGTAVPTVRMQCERIARALDAPLVRINPREAHGPSGTISLSMGALEAIEAIDRRL